MEWLKELFSGNIFAVIMAVAGFMGCFSKAVISAGLGRLYIQSESFGTSSDIFLKKLRLRYENGVKLGVKVQNTEVFVRKYLEKFRYFNLAVSDYDRITWISVLLCVMLALVGSVYSRNIWFMAYGGACALAVVCVDKIENIDERRENIVINVVDYFDNFQTVGKKETEIAPKNNEFSSNTYETDRFDKNDMPVITDAQRALIEQVLNSYNILK